ncbi:MAG TPA: urate hydroxylase PuuD, partial [Gammaproteobacteria bacterium]|nr:urate hydroxylase PuuD [Gammaproteobacteria bacterium]
MEAHLHEWANLLVRWIHVITGIAWIGASFYFNWLENNLEREGKAGGIAGNLWAIHGGGFNFVQKYEVAPGRLPETLHWFKWEAYTTWMSGFAL